MQTLWKNRKNFKKSLKNCKNRKNATIKRKRLIQETTIRRKRRVKTDSKVPKTIIKKFLKRNARNNSGITEENLSQLKKQLLEEKKKRRKEI